MPDQITTAMQQQFADNFRLVAQQLETEIRSWVTVETDIKLKKYMDYVGVAGEPEQQVALVQDLNLDEMPHSRRVVIAYPYVKGVPVPKAAVARVIADPTNPYMLALKATFERFLQKTAFLAAIGTSITAATDLLTESTIALADYPTEGANQQKIVESDTVGMTASKLILALERFNLNERANSEKVLWLGPKQVTNLLEDPDVTGPDEEALRLLRTGKVQNEMFWGFQTRMANNLPKTDNIRSCMAWCKEGVGLGLNQEYEGEIQPRYDKINLKQLVGTMDFGCTRLAETDVFEIQCYEAT